MHELRPVVSVEGVFHNSFDRLSIPRNRLHGTGCLVPAARRVKENQPAGAVWTVMPADDSSHHGGMIGDRPRIEDGIRPVRIAAVVLHLARAVRVHVKEQAAELMAHVGVFVACVEHSPVIQQRRVPIALLIEGQQPRVLSVAIGNAEVRDVGLAILAGHSGEQAGGVKNDASVGQVAGIAVVDIGSGVCGHLVQPSTIQIDFEYLKGAGGPRHGKQQPVGIKVKLGMLDHVLLRRLKNRSQRSVERLHRHGRDLFLPPRGDRRVLRTKVARPIDRHAILLTPLPIGVGLVGFRRLAFQNQDLVEDQQRIGQKQRALKGQHTAALCHGPVDLVDVAFS